MAPLSNDRSGQLLDPPIPTYDEATSRNTNGEHITSNSLGALPSPSTFDPISPMGEAFYAPDSESRALLRQSHHRSISSATEATTATTTARRHRSRPSGYRPPTVETDDEDSTWSSSDSDDGTDINGDSDAEEAHVRREMFELDIDDPLDGETHRQRGRPSLFGKTIGFSNLLPRWKWKWSMPRIRIRLPDGISDSPSLGSRLSRFAGFARLGGRSDEAAIDGGETGPEPETRTQRRRQCWPSWLKPNSTSALIFFGRLFALLLVLGFVYLVFISDIFSNLSRRLGSQNFDPESVRFHIQSSVNPKRMRDLSKHFTSYAHMAGTEGDFAQAVDVKNLFQQYGLEGVTVDEYYVYLNYPKAGGRAVEILRPDGTVKWTAKLEEEEVGTETAGHQTYIFHGMSKSGSVKGSLIYANYGSREDFQKLRESGINTTGAIALVRNYGTQGDRALKVKAAELEGFAGCLIYTDPKDDGFLLGEVAPKGRFMPADAVQRGSVSLMSWVIGDVLTPGWESKKGMPRLKPEMADGLVKIPSLPLAWRDAKVLLQSLRGVGQKVPDGWAGGVPDVEWWTGDASGSPIVHLKNEQDEVSEQPIWNVYGRIEGIEQTAKTVIIGNHRDSWTFGATDPHSGTAVMLEMASIFGDLLDRGWRPLRTIEFMSWDAEEYNLIGSTEYVEKNLDALRNNALAYINLDTAVSGQELHATGSPVFAKLLMQILKRVGDPNTNSSLYDRWVARHGLLEIPGAGSDYVAFQDLAGTSSLDLHFDGPGYPLHTSYDNFDWMDRVGDPGFVYHGLLAQVVGLMLIELADRPVMPFDMSAYGAAINSWTKDLMSWVQSEVMTASQAGKGNQGLIRLEGLHFASNVIVAAVREFEQWEQEWESDVMSAGGWEPAALGRQREEYNSRMARFETDLLDLATGGGIPNRTQFKHVLYGPRLWSSYEGELFPAVRDAVAAGDWINANQTVAKIANIFQKAAANLIR